MGQILLRITFTGDHDITNAAKLQEKSGGICISGRKREILELKEGVRMNNMSFFKGIGIGVVVGSIAGMIISPRKNRKSQIGKALKSMGDVVENVAGSIGL